MSKLTIVLCAVLFSSVAFVSSQPEIIQEKWAAGLAAHDRLSQYVNLRAFTITSNINIIEDALELLTNNFEELYDQVSAVGNVDYCKHPYLELRNRTQHATALSHNCVFDQITDACAEINENERQFTLRFDTIINNAQRRKAQESVATSTIKNAENEETLFLNNVDELLAETTNSLNSIMNRFEVSLNTCIHGLRDVDIDRDGLQVINQFGECAHFVLFAVPGA